MKKGFKITMCVLFVFVYVGVNTFNIYLSATGNEAFASSGEGYLCHAVSFALFLTWLLCWICPRKFATFMYKLGLKMDQKSLIEWDVGSPQQIYKTVKKAVIYLPGVSCIFLMLWIFLGS